MNFFSCETFFIAAALRLLAFFACRASLAVVFAFASAVAAIFGLGVGLDSFAVLRLRLPAVADLLAVVNANVVYFIFLSLVLRVARANSWVKAQF